MESWRPSTVNLNYCCLLSEPRAPALSLSCSGKEGQSFCHLPQVVRGSELGRAPRDPSLEAWQGQAFGKGPSKS